MPKNPIAEYEEARQSVDAHQNDINGNQPDDPEKAAEVMIKIAWEANPPLHLFLGNDACEMAKAKIADVQKDMQNRESLATATDFDVEDAEIGKKASN